MGKRTKLSELNMKVLMRCGITEVYQVLAGFGECRVCRSHAWIKHRAWSHHSSFMSILYLIFWWHLTYFSVFTASKMQISNDWENSESHNNHYNNFEVLIQDCHKHMPVDIMDSSFNRINHIITYTNSVKTLRQQKKLERIYILKRKPIIRICQSQWFEINYWLYIKRTLFKASSYI